MFFDAERQYFLIHESKIRMGFNLCCHLLCELWQVTLCLSHEMKW